MRRLSFLAVRLIVAVLAPGSAQPGSRAALLLLTFPELAREVSLASVSFGPDARVRDVAASHEASRDPRREAFGDSPSAGGRRRLGASRLLRPWADSARHNPIVVIRKE